MGNSPTAATAPEGKALDVIHVKQKIPNWRKPFPVMGQGTVVFNIIRDSPFSLVIRPKPRTILMKKKKKIPPAEWVALEIYTNMARFVMKRKGEPAIILHAVYTGHVGRKSVGYDAGKKMAYWFSYDRDNLVLKYGKGHRMEETTLLIYDFLAGLDPKTQAEMRTEYNTIFSHKCQKLIEQYDLRNDGTLGRRTRSMGSLIDVEMEVEFDKVPVKKNPSPFVLDSSLVTMADIEEGKYTFSSDLPVACQQMYPKIVNIGLDWPNPDYEDFSLAEAIRNSLDTDDGMLRTKLKQKASLFDKDNPNLQKTYLRITLGGAKGTSPGQPFVLEIWPSGHFSPVHSHGNACAMINVLHGGLTVNIYNKMTEPNIPEHLAAVPAHQGDITWLSRNWYQTHKLHNETDDFCAALHAYQYDTEDQVHWPYFDYEKEDRSLAEFKPNSDFDYIDMCNKLFAEYSAFVGLKLSSKIDDVPSRPTSSTTTVKL